MKNIEMFETFCRNSLEANDVDPAISYLNYMIDRMEMNEEQILWLCFLYAVTYQLPSAYLIWNEYPDLEIAGIDRLEKWWKEAQFKIPFQTDKMKQRKDFCKTVASYQKLVGGSQKKYFDQLLSSENPQENFDRLWTPLKSVDYFGRFSTWNWCQALKHIAGYNIEPVKLMLGESDAVSFTDGLAYAFGFTEKVTKKIDGKKIYYKWTSEEKNEMEKLSRDFKSRLNIDNFQLETLACAFKKIWRTKNSRYVGYYNDRLADDIKALEKNWQGVDWELLWDARAEVIPGIYLHGNRGVDSKKYLLSPEEKIAKDCRENPIINIDYGLFEE